MNLPPLPEFDDLDKRFSHSHVYTAVQMRAYAAEAVRVALEQADALTYCGCGDQFTADEPGRCAICVMMKGQT